MYGKPSAQQVHQLTFQLATLLQSQLPLIKALHLIAATSQEKALRKFLQHLITQIQQGRPLHAALADYPRLFNKLFIHLVNIGESMGCLGNILQQLALYQQEQQRLRKQLTKALSYPLFILVFTLIMCTVLLLKIIPEFARLFQQFKQELPTLTQQMIDLSAWMQAYSLHLTAIPATAWLVLLAGRRFHRIHKLLAWISIRLPLTGTMITYASVIKYSQTLHMILDAKVSLDKAMDIASDLELNAAIKQQLQQLAQAVQQGTSIQQYMLNPRNCRPLPTYMLQVLSIGEQTGQHSPLLHSLIHDYQQRFQSKVQLMISLIEPLFMLILGLLIGTLITAVYLPLFQLGNLF